jgi:hypothetical protein
MIEEKQKPATVRIAADYSTRQNYQRNYVDKNRDTINAKKREWRKARKQAGFARS